MKLNEAYWSKRYEHQDTPWDAGTITTPIKDFVDLLTDKELKILVPGVGTGHELEYIYNSGFKNVAGLDISERPVVHFLDNNPHFPKEQMYVGDFFEHEEKYDLIIEQTFFCALEPELRPLYAAKMHALLKEGGILAGVLFSFPLTEQGPPFGGSSDEYRKLFAEHFSIQTLDPCYNSIEPRKNRELFIILKK